jgi:hypothetical protein
MKVAIVVGVMLLGVVGADRGLRQESANQNESAECKMVLGALQASDAIKVGMTRREVAEHWSEDGGLQFRRETRYVYEKCAYIRVDVKFKLAEPTDAVEVSPDDEVSEVSKPYLAYPDAD